MSCAAALSPPTVRALHAPSFSLLPCAWVRAVRHTATVGNTDSRGKRDWCRTVTLKMDLSTDVKGRDVILVEDIVDTGCVVRPMIVYSCMHEWRRSSRARASDRGAWIHASGMTTHARLEGKRRTCTPSSLQGQYKAGGRIHTPSRVAPSVGHHQLCRSAAPLTHHTWVPCHLSIKPP